MSRQTITTPYFYVVKQFSFAGKPCPENFGVEVNGWLPGADISIVTGDNARYMPILQRNTIIPIVAKNGEQRFLSGASYCYEQNFFEGCVGLKAAEIAEAVAEIIALKGADADLETELFVGRGIQMNGEAFQGILIPDVIRPAFTGYGGADLYNKIGVSPGNIFCAEAVARLYDGKCDLSSANISNANYSHNLRVGVRVTIPCPGSISIDTISGKINIVPIGFCNAQYFSFGSGYTEVYDAVLATKEKYASYGAMLYPGWVVYRPELPVKRTGEDVSATDPAWSAPVISLQNLRKSKMLFYRGQLLCEEISDMPAKNYKAVCFQSFAFVEDEYSLSDLSKADTAVNIDDKVIFMINDWKSYGCVPRCYLLSFKEFVQHLRDVSKETKFPAETFYCAMKKLCPEKIGFLATVKFVISKIKNTISF